MSYSDKLKDPRWQKKRLEILERDGWACVNCGETKKTLHVHHLAYLRGLLPWEHPDNLLVTYCEPCHERERVDRQQLEERLVDTLKSIGVSCGGLEDLCDTIELLGVVGGPSTMLDRENVAAWGEAAWYRNLLTRLERSQLSPLEEALTG